MADALNVCVKNLADWGLAYLITKCMRRSGEDDLLGTYVLRNFVIPTAVLRNDRWLVNWSLWSIGERELAIKALIVSSISSGYSNFNEMQIPLQQLFEELEIVIDPSVDSPALVVLYRQSRRFRHTAGESTVDLDAIEFQFVLYVTRLYSQMGCGFLALALASGWKFASVRKPLPSTMQSSQPGMIRMQQLGDAKDKPTGEKITSFVEPDLSEIFDFGK